MANLLANWLLAEFQTCLNDLSRFTLISGQCSVGVCGMGDGWVMGWEVAKTTMQEDIV